MQKKKHNNQSRNLKIQKKYFSRTYKTVVYPEIRLSGKWLQEAGFDSGKAITVTCFKNKIIITIQQEMKGGKK